MLIAIISGNLFDFLHNNCMLIVLIRLASILMSIYNIQFYDKKISVDICFLGLSEEFRRDFKTEFELSKKNEPSVFELLRFDCIFSTNHLRIL